MWSVIQEKKVSTSMETWKKNTLKGEIFMSFQRKFELKWWGDFLQAKVGGGRERWRHFAMLDTLNAQLCTGWGNTWIKGWTDSRQWCAGKSALWGKTKPWWCNKLPIYVVEILPLWPISYYQHDITDHRVRRCAPSSCNWFESTPAHCWLQSTLEGFVEWISI